MASKFPLVAWPYGPSFEQFQFPVANFAVHVDQKQPISNTTFSMEQKIRCSCWINAFCRISRLGLSFIFAFA